MTGDERSQNSIVGGLLVLIARGVLLWLVVPSASVIWLAVGFRLRERGVSFFQYLGWIDLNLIAFLQRGVFRFAVRSPAGFVPSRDMPSVTHRLRTIDPV